MIFNHFTQLPLACLHDDGQSYGYSTILRPLAHTTWLHIEAIIYTTYDDDIGGVMFDCRGTIRSIAKVRNRSGTLGPSGKTYHPRFLTRKHPSQFLICAVILSASFAACAALTLLCLEKRFPQDGQQKCCSGYLCGYSILENLTAIKPCKRYGNHQSSAIPPSTRNSFLNRLRLPRPFPEFLQASARCAAVE